MQTFVLSERVLTDNELLIPESGKVFTGGYIAIVKEHEFENSWADRVKAITRFKKIEKLKAFLSKNYPDFDFDSIEL